MGKGKQSDKTKQKKKALTIGAGLVLLGSMASSTTVHEPKILSEEKVEIAAAQEFSSGTLQDLIAESGVVLTVDVLQMMLGPAVSADDIDVVTAPSMRYR